MGVGNEYRKKLAPREREALSAGAAVLIDSLFDDYCRVQSWKPETILATRLGKHLPRQYFATYTPLFFKQFGTCVVTAAWKLAQPEPLPPASIAERLAAWAILAEAKDLLTQKSEGERAEEAACALEEFLNRYVADTTFLALFDPARDGIRAISADPKAPRTSLAFEHWFRPIAKARQFAVHPYAYDEGRVGQAYKRWLTPFERRVLAVGVSVLIDEIFDDFVLAERREPEDFALTALGWHLPMCALPKYTPLFLKQFVVCILNVAYKLAQPKCLMLSSVGEELAAWAIITTAKHHFELEQEIALEEDEDDASNLQNAEDAFEDLIEVLFDDEDFLFLFDQKYDGIDASPVGALLHMTSLAYEDWLRPFTNEPERIAHPYVYRQ